MNLSFALNTMERAYAPSVPVAHTSVNARASFITKTYNTLFLAIFAFAGLEVAIFTSGYAEPIARVLSGNWLLVMGAFLVAGMLGSSVAMKARTQAAAYAALGGFVLIEALVFVPLLYMANQVAPGATSSAALVTMLGFGGLTAIAWTTRKDFSFLGGMLRWGGIMAIVLMVASAIFGFQLGTFFSVVMVAFAGASILYQTSNVLLHYPEDRHVAAALALFSSVATMFWYVLRIFISSRD
jgi:FtsH-binding integral membrane protein